MAGFLAVLYSLSIFSTWAAFWPTFGLALFFIALILVVSVSAFVMLHRVLSLRRNLASAVLFVALVLATTFVISAAALWMLNVSPPSLSARDFLLRNLAFALVASVGLAHYLAMKERWRQQVAAEAQTRLAALQTRIRPHFLFNALNTIAGVIHENPERAEEATLDLADLLRTGLRSDDRHSLDDELELVGRYLRLESLRLGERLQVAWQLADDLPLDQSLPPLLLQPLVENAIVHGISRRTDGGTVLIRGERIRFGRIRFTITNPLADAGGRSGSGSGTALENIRQRLALAYEERYGLKTGIEDGQFKAELTIPVS